MMDVEEWKGMPKKQSKFTFYGRNEGYKHQKCLEIGQPQKNQANSRKKDTTY